VQQDGVDAPTLFDTGFSSEKDGGSDGSYSDKQRDAMKTIAANLLEIRDILATSHI
jgi:hypothetical protein